MSQLFENFNSVATSYTNISTLTFRAAESFTPQQKHLINSVKLKVYRTINAPTGVMTVEIRTDNAGVPSATVLASGTSDPVTWDAITWHWREITLNAQPMLSAGVKYWIVISCAGVDASHYIRWQRDSGGTYAGGNMATSTNNGDSWTAYTANDYMFEEWGEPGTSFVPAAMKYYCNRRI